MSSQLHHPTLLLLCQERSYCDQGRQIPLQLTSSKVSSKFNPRAIRLTSFTQVFAKEVVDKVTQISLFETFQSEMKVIELDKEKSRTEMAFHDFVPPAVVKRIKSKKGKEV